MRENNLIFVPDYDCMRGFEIIELKQLAGDRCKIYTVRMAGGSGSQKKCRVDDVCCRYDL